MQVGHETVYILDFGAQYAQLIARRVREHNCYCEIVPCDVDPDRLKDAQGIILTGGPASVYDPEAPAIPQWVIDQGLPVLGICYGMQALVQKLGGKVSPGDVREYGQAELRQNDAECSMFEGMPESFQVGA